MSEHVCDLYGSSNFRKYEDVIVAEYCMMAFLSVVGENKNAWEVRASTNTRVEDYLPEYLHLEPTSGHFELSQLEC